MFKGPVVAMLLSSGICDSDAQQSAHYKVHKGKLHKSGSITATILPEPEKFMVKLDYKVKKKSLVPVSSSALSGSKTYEFPKEFRTEKGYKELEEKSVMDIPKAQLRFVRRADYASLKMAYYFEVHPTNKKSKIEIVYHPSLPAVGWYSVKITFISPFPILDGYQIEAELEQ